MSPFSFLTLLTCAFFSFFPTLARDLLIFLIFLKQSALDLRVFSTVSPFSVSSVSALTFITPSFCLLWLQFALIFPVF